MQRQTTSWVPGRGAPTFSVAGIPIRIHPSWFVVFLLVTWSLATGVFPVEYPAFSPARQWVLGAIASVSLFACVLLHELGHSLVARANGIPVNSVTLFLFGGVAQIGGDAKKPSVEFQVAVAGPVVSALIASICFLAVREWRVHDLDGLAVLAILRYLSVINVAIILFNLLPGFPLDGGRVVRAGLWAWTGSRAKATRITSLMGLGLAVGLLGFGVWTCFKGTLIGGAWYVMLGLFLRDAARTGYRQADR